MKALVCLGTRPEAIKLAPVVRELKRRDRFKVVVCATAQHREMLDQVLSIFEIAPDHDLNLMAPGQSLEKLTAALMRSMAGVIEQERPDVVIVQGDTTTTFVSALAAYYQRVAVAHVEAGLRTHRKYAPFPEEVNRQMTSCIADWHFAPTQRARQALLSEGRPESSVFVVGNTVIDALFIAIEKVRRNGLSFRERFAMLDTDRRMLLVTGHRRENFGEGFLGICHALRELASRNPSLQIVYPVHLNPNVQRPVRELLSDLANVYLIEPQDYLAFIWLLDRSSLVLTDSGGVQEEAPSLGKPVLVMRETTERPEAIEAGVARLVGTDAGRIVDSVQRLLDDRGEYEQMSRAQNPYGEGTSAAQIAEILEVGGPVIRG